MWTSFSICAHFLSLCEHHFRFAPTFSLYVNIIFDLRPPFLFMWTSFSICAHFFSLCEHHFRFAPTFSGTRLRRATGAWCEVDRLTPLAQSAAQCCSVSIKQQTDRNSRSCVSSSRETRRDDSTRPYPSSDHIRHYAHLTSAAEIASKICIQRNITWQQRHLCLTYIAVHTNCVANNGYANAPPCYAMWTPRVLLRNRNFRSHLSFYNFCLSALSGWVYQKCLKQLFF